MKQYIQWFMQLDFRKAIWIAPLAWALYDAEEWNIDVFERTHFADPGHFALVDHSVLWIGPATVALDGIIWTALTAWPKNAKFAAFLTLPFFVYLSFGKFLQHIYYPFHFVGYTPGVTTAVLLVGPIVIGLTVKAIRDKLIPWWFGAVLYLLVAPSVVCTVRAANHVLPQLPPQLVAARNNGVNLARAILGRNKSVVHCRSKLVAGS